ncbi:MFS transporter [Streptomyces longispororuber]|uniref:MFS transporter n=1 Tax=Streptomyces longispororuber TaxID=68230 RepID=A0A918Z9E2_9ACTN|nr:MFS transporter [Streptomyces longispororuber]GHE41172.1 MFS transporter [Streptomyces longispororuber]
MTGRRTLGPHFGRLWTAYAVNAYGTWLGFGAFPLIAVSVLRCGPAEVAALAATGRAAGAVAALPLGPWVEFHRKRPVMVAMDLTRGLALLSVPAAYALGRLTFVQLLAVSVVVATAGIAFTAASGAYMKALVPPEGLLAANGRFEATTWTATMVGPPLGGAAVGVFGPVTTVVADAVSHLLSALGIRSLKGPEPRPARTGGPRAGALLEGWRHLLGHPSLRPLFLNAIVVNGLIMAGEPLLAVLLLDRYGYAPWQYGLVFAVPCVGGLVGSRLAHRLVARFGRHTTLRAAGALRACWPLGLAFAGPGVPGMVLVIVVQFGLVTCCGVFNPVLATWRLDHTAPGLLARTLTAWSVGTSTGIAALTALWGLLGALTGPRAALAAAGVLLLSTSLLLPRRGDTEDRPPVEAAGVSRRP